MSESVRDLLASFDALPAAERHQAAVEILRRSTALGPAEIPEAAFSEVAEELFLALDAAEADGAQP
jgi:hypothetical protein